MREKVIKLLAEKGYQAKLKQKVNNGVTCEGIAIINPDSNISPCCYPDWNDPIEKIVEDTIRIYEKYKNHPGVEISVEKIMSPEFWRKHLLITLQRESSENIIKMNAWKGTEAYLRLVWDECSIKIAPKHLEMVGMTEDEAWGWAYDNTEKNSVFINMADMLPEEIVKIIPQTMYVATNGRNYNGAAASLCEDKLNEICLKENVTKLIVIPASIHECLLVPVTDYESIEMVNQMVREVNTEIVNVEEQLSDQADVYEMK